MKWFLALNQGGSTAALYHRLVKVAVLTARRYTRLEPHLIYDGTPDELTAWFERHGGRVIYHRTYLYDQLAALAGKVGKDYILTIGAGAFLRVDLPRLAERSGIFDQFVLYTDVDVMFTGDVSGLARMTPRYFAVAPENRDHPRLSINSGVMLMNLPRLRAEDARFRRFTEKNLALFAARCWDQDAFRTYYTTRLHPELATDEWLTPYTWWLRRARWDALPLNYNWRPYWGANSEARIVHFHGLKPFHRQWLTGPNRDLHLEVFSHLATGAYEELSRRWEQVDREAA